MEILSFFSGCSIDGFGLLSLFCGFWLNKEQVIMDNKPAQNIQDSFLNTARKDKAVITIYLLSGVKLSGRIRSFDKYSVVLETNNQEQLIFKHAISTVVMARGAHISDRAEFRPAPAAGTSAPTTNNTAPAESGSPSPEE
jgi:host factor-I protein